MQLIFLSCHRAVRAFARQNRYRFLEEGVYRGPQVCVVVAPLAPYTLAAQLGFWIAKVSPTAVVLWKNSSSAVRRCVAVACEDGLHSLSAPVAADIPLFVADTPFYQAAVTALRQFMSYECCFFLEGQWDATILPQPVATVSTRLERCDLSATQRHWVEKALAALRSVGEVPPRAQLATLEKQLLLETLQSLLQQYHIAL